MPSKLENLMTTLETMATPPPPIQKRPAKPTARDKRRAAKQARKRNR